MGFLGKLFGIEQTPLESIIEKAGAFLNPQIILIEQTYANKYSVITGDSLVYTVGIGEEIAGREITAEEIGPYLIAILGSDYEPRIQHIFDHVNIASFNAFKSKMKIMLKEDIRNGNSGCSNFLVTHAQECNDLIG